MTAEGAVGAAGQANRSLVRAALLLDIVEGGPISTGELARRSGLSTSAVYRLVADLVELGFLHRGVDGTVSLGRRFTTSSIERASTSVLERLRDDTGETAQLWVRRGSIRECLVTYESPHELRATLPVGARLPLPAGSSGALLAREPAALAAVRSQGWVESVGRRTPGLASVSAPVVVDGNLVAAVCVPVPVARVAAPGLTLGAAVATAARDISAAMGVVQPLPD